MQFFSQKTEAEVAERWAALFGFREEPDEKTATDSDADGGQGDQPAEPAD